MSKKNKKQKTEDIKTKIAESFRISTLAGMVAIFILATLLNNLNSHSAVYAANQTKTVRVYPLETKLFTLAQRAEFTKSLDGFTDPSMTVLTQAVDAARPQAPAWQPTTIVTANKSDWTGVNYSFDFAAIRACSLSTSTVSVRQHGSYSVTPLSSNSRNTLYNDAFQKLNISSLVLDDQKIPGNKVPGTTSVFPVNGGAKTVKQTDLAHLKVASIVQLRESGTGKINTKVDDIWVDVTYSDRCSGSSVTSRYEQQVFPDTPIAHQNVIYSKPVNYLGQLENQTMDIYQPKGDSMVARPLLIFIHSGGFYEKTKEEQTGAAQYYAKLGYTTATINYRLRPNIYNGSSFPTFDAMLPAIQDALTDSKEAVKYLKQNRLTYKIDSNKIAVLGYSAGGITALNNYLAITDSNSTGQLGTVSSRVSAVSSLSGWLTRASQPVISANKPAVQMVNYQSDPFYSLWSSGMLEPTSSCQQIRSVGGVCDQYTIPGYGHVMDFVSQKDRVIPFLKTYLNL